MIGGADHVFRGVAALVVLHYRMCTYLSPIANFICLNLKKKIYWYCTTMIGGEDHVLREAAALIASTSAKYIIASSEMSRNFKFFINM